MLKNGVQKIKYLLLMTGAQIKHQKKKNGIRMIRHETNLGYGAAQKNAYNYASCNGINKVIMVHGDGQHNPEFIPDFVKKLDSGCDFVIGSRMINKREALKGKMPLYKFLLNILLTFIENKACGIRLSEYHSGYRGLSGKFIKQLLPYLKYFSNDYIFDQQILLTSLYLGYKVGEVEVTTIYNKFSSHIGLIDGIKYSFETLNLSLKFYLWRKGATSEFLSFLR